MLYFDWRFTVYLTISLQLQQAHPYAIITRPLFLPSILLEKNRPGNEANYNPDYKLLNCRLMVKQCELGVSV